MKRRYGFLVKQEKVKGEGLGFGVWGLGFGVWGIGYRVSGKLSKAQGESEKLKTKN